MTKLWNLVDLLPLILIVLAFYVIPLTISLLGFVMAYVGVFYKGQPEEGDSHTATVKIKGVEINLNGTSRFAMVVGGIAVAVIGAWTPTVAPPVSAEEAVSTEQKERNALEFEQARERSRAHDRIKQDLEKLRKQLPGSPP